MNREFLLNILFLVFINVLIKPLFIFGVDLGVQNRVGEGEYGLYFTLSSFILLFQIVNDFGIQNFNNRHISRHPHLLPKYFPNLLALKVILSTAFVALTCLGALLWGYEWSIFPLLLVLLVNQVLIQLTFFLRSNLSGLGHYRLDSFFSALDKLLMLATCGALFVLPGPITIMHFALAQTVALALTALWVFVALRRRASFPVRPAWARNLRAGRAFLLAMLRQSTPYALVVFLMYAYTRLDAVLLERLLPNGRLHADVYAGAYRLLDAVNMLGYLFATLLLPMFARLRAKHESVAPLVKMSLSLIWAGSVALAVVVFFSRTELVAWMFPEKNTIYRADTLGILIWVFVPVSVTYVFSTLLTADGRLMQMNRFFLVAVGLDVLLNLVLTPNLQARGAALSALITQVFVAGSMVFLCVREFRFSTHWRHWVPLLAYSVLLPSGAWAVFQHLQWPWIGQVSAVLVLAGAAAWALGLVRPRAWVG